MEIFTENPNKSFKINRKSPLANKLKLSISDKLLEFLGSYTDDVLAEYITVLVCNGKNQNQARDDLEAFLGQRSGDFVSWLWDLLKVGNQSSSTTCLLDPIDLSSTSPNRGDTDRDLRSNRSKVLQNHNIGIAESSRQVRNVKERLHQIELEMSRLRSKQLEMKKGRQPNLLSSSGEDISTIRNTFLKL